MVGSTRATSATSRKNGHLYITDRKKDLFKLSNGKYVAPQLIESLLKESEFVSQVVVVGAGRKQPVALIVPDWESLNEALAEAGEQATKDHVELSKFPAGDQDRPAGHLKTHFINWLITNASGAWRCCQMNSPSTAANSHPRSKLNAKSSTNATVT